MKMFCNFCVEEHDDTRWRGSLDGWVCGKWFTPTKPANAIKNRALRPDGSVATGREAERMRDVRRRAQEQTQ